MTPLESGTFFSSRSSGPMTGARSVLEATAAAGPQGGAGGRVGRSKLLLAGLLACCIGASGAIAAPETLPEDPDVPRLRLAEQGDGSFRLSSEAGSTPIDAAIPRAWLISPAEEAAEQESYVPTSQYHEVATAFPIRPGWLGIHLSSYAIQVEGSAGAAAGRDVFLVYDARSRRLQPGLTELGVTKERIRQGGCWTARQIRFLLADADGDGATDIGVEREVLDCTGRIDDDRPVEASEPCHTRTPVAWHLFAEGRWNPVPDAVPRDLAGEPRRLPWIGITKGPVDFLLEVMTRGRGPLRACDG